MEVVGLESITKQYPGVLLLTMQIWRFAPEKYMPFGENGAGKTTLMKVLYGMTVPDEGKIYINKKQ